MSTNFHIYLMTAVNWKFSCNKFYKIFYTSRIIIRPIMAKKHKNNRTISSRLYLIVHWRSPSLSEIPLGLICKLAYFNDIVQGQVYKDLMMPRHVTHTWIYVYIVWRKISPQWTRITTSISCTPVFNPQYWPILTVDMCQPTWPLKSSKNKMC